MDSLPADAGAGPLALAVLARFRREFHACLTARGDEVFELADAVLVRGRAGAEPGRLVAGAGAPARPWRPL